MTLLPMVIGLILWNSLPAQIEANFSVVGSVNAGTVRFLLVIAGPVFYLLLHWLSIYFTSADPGNQRQNWKIMQLAYIFVPLLSVYCSGIFYSMIFGTQIRHDTNLKLFFGPVYVIIGNYLPKCRPNYTIGIRVPWVYNNEENWIRTHRFGGKCFFFGGLLMMISVFIPGMTGIKIYTMVILITTFLPIIYSFVFYLYQKRHHTDTTPVTISYKGRTSGAARISFAAAAIIGAAAIVLLISGNIRYQYGDDSFTINATYWHDLTVDYADIENIELRAYKVPGVRTMGFGSLTLGMGTFENDEFDTYTHYTYTRCSSNIVLTINGKRLVISGANDADTQAIYDALLARTQL